MNAILLLAILGGLPEVRKVDTCPTGSTLVSGTCVRTNPVGPGVTTVMPAGVRSPSFIHLASAPTINSAIGGSAATCVATNISGGAGTPIADQSPFCPVGSFPPASCQGSTRFIYNPIDSPAQNAYSLPYAPNAPGQPGVGNWTACALAKSGVAGSGAATFMATADEPDNYPAAGWALYEYGSGYPAHCYVKGGDGVHGFYGGANPAPESAAWGLCCVSFTHGGNAITYWNGSAETTIDVSTVGNINNTNAMTIGAVPGSVAQRYYGDIAAGWYWQGTALTAGNMAALWAGIQATGMSTASPSGVTDPTYAWLGSSPLQEAIWGYTVTPRAFGLDVPGDPYCSAAAMPTSGACIQARWFNGQEYYDCGNINDPGTGDWSMCTVSAGSGSGTQVVASKVDGITTNGFWWSNSASPLNDAFTSVWHNSALTEYGGPQGQLYNDWVVNCGVYTASAGGGSFSLCSYQNGQTFPGACRMNTSATMHTTGHFEIGNLYYSSVTVGQGTWMTGFRGQYVGTWYWPVALTASEVASFSATWRSGAKSGLPYRVLYGNQLIGQSAGM